MKDNKILSDLKNAINNANIIKVEYGITGQEIDEGDLNKLLTISSNTTMKVDYIQKTGSIVTVKGSFHGSTTIKEVFDNYLETVTQSDSNSKTISTTSVRLSQEDYNNLFNPGGKLYPMEIEELIPVESPRNSDKTQVCSPSNKIIDSIVGYIKATYTIYNRSENIYDVTMIMNQLDSSSEILLMQYCFTTIEILS